MTCSRPERPPLPSTYTPPLTAKASEDRHAASAAALAQLEGRRRREASALEALLLDARAAIEETAQDLEASEARATEAERRVAVVQVRGGWHLVTCLDARMQSFVGRYAIAERRVPRGVDIEMGPCSCTLQ